MTYSIPPPGDNEWTDIHETSISPSLAAELGARLENQSSAPSDPAPLAGGGVVAQPLKRPEAGPLQNKVQAGRLAPSYSVGGPRAVHRHSVGGPRAARPATGEVRAVASSGGQKGRKPEMYSLIPVRPLAEVARCYGYGATKYPDQPGRPNFMRGYPWSWSIDALERHIAAWKRGERLDFESDLDHRAHAVWHLLTSMEWERRGIGEDDRVYKEEKDGK